MKKALQVHCVASILMLRAIRIPHKKDDETQIENRKPKTMFDLRICCYMAGDEIDKIKIKVLIKAITVFSLISVLLLVLVEITVPDANRRLQFIADWVQYILIGFSIPLVFRGFSLAANTEKIQPKIWLIIDGVATSLYYIFLLSFGFWQETKDMQNAFQGSYETVRGIVSFSSPGSGSVEVFFINGIEFQINSRNLGNIQNHWNYQITYLKNSKYIIEIVDASGNSVLQ